MQQCVYILLREVIYM